MQIKCFTVGSYETNCYIVSDEETLECAVVDPGADGSTILNYLEEARLACRLILLTHGHFDHTGAVETLMEETGAPLYMHEADNGVTIGGDYYRFSAPEGTKFYKDGDTLVLGSLNFTVLETPGHTPGSVTLRLSEAGSGDQALFTGDTLFRDSCGRTDFPGGSTDEILRSLKRLAALPGDYEVYPGHMGATTLERERNVNLFMLQALRN